MWTVVLLFVFTGAALCGRFKDPLPITVSDPRIVGGKPAEIGAHPWQLTLEICQEGYDCRQFCGAVLINKDTALTAAHCVEELPADLLQVGAGVTDKTSSLNRQTIQVSRVTMHPGYSYETGLPNDIAVLKLATPASIEGSEFISDVKLAPKGLTFDGYSCTLTGWGRLEGGGARPDWLQEVDMTVISNPKCASMWQHLPSANINDGHICILEENKSACHGDSGGPMVCRHEGTVYLAGITSWGQSSCQGQYPTVYTRVSHFLEWIDIHI